MPTFTPRLNLTQPDTGNKTWETDVENWANQLDKASAQYLSIHQGGAAIDEEVIFDGHFFDEDVTITAVTLHAREAPNGAPFSIDFTKGGIEQAKTAILADSSKKSNTAITGLSYTTLEEFGIKVKSVGSTDPGSEITILVHYHIKALI
ncbi:MAG: hypothetical protein OEM27_06920 [Nitrospinota bacterium]|nr:hypothetical protein [Nitrospinota bacterium]